MMAVAAVSKAPRTLVARLPTLGLVSVYFLEYGTARTFEKNVALPFAPGFRQPETVGGGDIRFDALGLQITLREEPAGTRLSAEVRGTPTCGWPAT